MFHRIDYKNQPKSIILSKGMSNYDRKLVKSMNEPLKEYNQIKDLVEIENNNITKINNTNINKQSKNTDLMPHKKGKNKK